MFEISKKLQSNKNAETWLSSAHFMNDVYTGILNPVMPLLSLKLGFSIATATLIISISHICSSLLQPIFGFFADNMRKRFFIFWGVLSTAIFIPLAVHAPNVIILTLFIALGSLGSSFFHPQATGLVSKFSTRNYSTDMSVFISIGSFGYSIGPVLAGVVTQFLGLDFISYLSFFGILTAICMFIFVPKITSSEIPSSNGNFFKVFGKILSNSNIMILMSLSVMKSIITNSCFILLPFLWHSIGKTPAQIGFYLCSFIFFGAIGSFVSAKMEKLFGTKNIFYLSLVTMFPLMTMFITATHINSFLFYPIFCTMGFATMLAMPVNIVMAQKIMPEFKSIIAGFVNGFTWGVSAILLTIIGLFAEKYGIKQVLICISILPCLFSYFVKFLPSNDENCK